MKPEPFTLTAIPCILSEGEHKGHLEFIMFVAENGKETQKWTAVNTGTLARDFMKVVDRSAAEDTLRRLSRGEQVLIPGFWALEEIRHKFGGAGNAWGEPWCSSDPGGLGHIISQ